MYFDLFPVEGVFFKELLVVEHLLGLDPLLLTVVAL